MFSPQGAEFLTTYNFPDIATFRKFKKYHPERFGVYIDCGEIAISDAKNVFLVGNTTARLKYMSSKNGSDSNTSPGFTSNVLLFI